MITKPPSLTQHQFDVVRCVTPGPIGRGHTYKEAAEFLDVTHQAIKKTLERFKIKFPSAWERVALMRRAAARQGRSLQQPKSLDSLFEDHGEESTHLHLMKKDQRRC